MALLPGPYRFRTVEAGGSADAEIGSNGLIPEVHAVDLSIIVNSPGRRQELFIRNETGRSLFFVVEDRTWATDALTGERVIAMPAFRRLCPEQLLRPGDDAEIGSVAIMFTDLQGSTQLYEQLGDANAYRLVRDHFGFLSGQMQRHNGYIVKTVGDAVMAVFGDPTDAVRAALSIQDEIARFNASRSDAKITVKLGLHAGPCIAVTTAGVLDYFGSTVNTASRLEHQCRGGEAVISEAVLAQDGVQDLVVGRPSIPDAVLLRGLSQPVRFSRIAPRADQR